jgi:hypothetical protein
MAELTVPRMDFSSLGQLPQVYRKAQADELRKQTLAGLGQGGQVDAATLLRSGDMSLAQLGMTLQQQQANDAWRRQESERAQKNADRSYGLQAQAAARANEVKPIFKEVTDPNTGATTIVAIDPKTMTAKPLNTGGGASPTEPNNPFNPTGGKFNEGQGKAAGFTDRMLQSEAILSGMAVAPGVHGPTAPGVQNEGASFAQTALSNRLETPVIGKVANYSISENRQKFNQAKRDFINAQLRRESGAAIAPSEFDSADKQYFPVPGDTPAIIAQKAANRRAAIQALGREGGPAYQPELSFDQSGAVAPRSAPVRPQGAPVRVTSPQQAASLPSGTQIILPDGSPGVVP